MPRGKGTATLRRVAERDAAEAEAAAAAAPRPPGQCPVVGCTNLGLCRHETPDGVIYLCGYCDIIARRNLEDEARREAILDAVAAPVKRAILLREKQRS
jgi:hypothetical protein